MHGVKDVGQFHATSRAVTGNRHQSFYYDDCRCGVGNFGVPSSL